MIRVLLNEIVLLSHVSTLQSLLVTSKVEVAVLLLFYMLYFSYTSISSLLFATFQLHSLHLNLQNFIIILFWTQWGHGHLIILWLNQYTKSCQYTLFVVHSMTVWVAGKITGTLQPIIYGSVVPVGAVWTWKQSFD